MESWYSGYVPRIITRLQIVTHWRCKQAVTRTYVYTGIYGHLSDLSGIVRAALTLPLNLTVTSHRDSYYIRW